MSWIRVRTGLQIKFVAVLLVFALVPLLASALLIDPITTAAQNFASNEAARLRPPLERAHVAYLDLLRTKKMLYQQITKRYAGDAALARHVTQSDTTSVQAWADAALASEPTLFGIRVTSSEGTTMGQAKRSKPATSVTRWRERTITESVPGTKASVAATFAADLRLLQDIEDLGNVLHHSHTIDKVRDELPSSYRTGFLLLLGGVMVVVAAAGILIARRYTSRIERLVAGTRAVAGGDLEARVSFEGRDELAELAIAFNRMVEDLRHDRDHIAYLQRVGAWQDVARQLAHEIKNPLTPIQLAVQQVVSSYDGDDDGFSQLLADASEIVTEEIASLRRLVDAFRTLGKLPKVEPAPLRVGLVVEDLQTDPVWSGKLETSAPAAPVTIRGDRLLLRRVLANLIENGIHAGESAERQGVVTVSWRADEGRRMAVITVDDEGAGVPETERERIFEPYVTGKNIGTGLGLAIAKKIALEHGGSLVVADHTPATGGARFVLCVPLDNGTSEESDKG